ncbi:MAG: multidrug ABC transporter ATP-binding protein [Gammaproteobacteria bacterium RIFCSPLOWO2_02_FULL_56_15]|nr:MAG: multidrug ABC transporter ATP-binding protein [Gammaproteobacteria bacterium RIFCSPLOWO2_02_FULL_56_15]
MPDNRPAIEVKSLDKYFGPIHAVRKISFSVDHGEVLGFLGPNGAGKSTTMKMIAGFLRPDGGTVLVNNLNVIDDPVGVKARIGYLPEGAPSYGEMTVEKFLRFIAEIRGFDSTERDKCIADIIRIINLGSVRKQTIETLSKGYRRRVGLAQAFLHDPDVLIMDEPTDGLDPNQKHEVRSLIKNMSSNKAIIISTHILEEVDAVCTRAIIISAGEILFDGSPGELRAKSDRNDIDDAFRSITTAQATGLAG